MKRRRSSISLAELVAHAPPLVVTQDIVAHDGALLRPALVERAEWADPDDLDPTNMATARRKQARRIDGFRRVSVIANLHARSPREITRQHLAAAERLTRHFEVGCEGAKGAGGRGGADDSEPGWPTRQRIFALTRYREAIQALGPRLAALVCAVVLANTPINQLARRIGISPDRTQGRLAAAMDRLCDHYWPDDKRSP